MDLGSIPESATVNLAGGLSVGVGCSGGFGDRREGNQGPSSEEHQEKDGGIW